MDRGVIEIDERDWPDYLGINVKCPNGDKFRVIIDVEADGEPGIRVYGDDENRPDYYECLLLDYAFPPR